MGKMYHLTLVASTTSLEIEVRKWVVLLMVAMGKICRNKRYILQDEEGKAVTIAALDAIFHDLLEKERNTKKILTGKDSGIQ